MEKTSKKKTSQLLPVLRCFFWFSIGASLGFFFLVSFGFIVFQKLYVKVIYPGVMVNGVNFGGNTKEKVKNYFAKKNEEIGKTNFTFVYQDKIATISASELGFGYDEELLSAQAYSLGRSKELLSNISLVLQAYLYGVNLPPFYHYSEEKLKATLKPFAEMINVAPIDALFKFENGKVIAFRPSSEGQELDLKKIKNEFSYKTAEIASSDRLQNYVISIPIKVLKPKVTTEKANDLGIEELVGSGSSLFQGSIQGRIYNITLASARLNGLLVAPGETFSFNQALGNVSSFTGYKQAYIIQEGRTVLGDGGGVCQVSTTLFRAVLDAGLPILERIAHAYRVGYYEQDSPPGLDATVYAPSVDFKFKNDTGNHLLIQVYINPTVERLTFSLYGTKDGRQVAMSKPVISSQSQPLPPLYQDDPTLPKNTTKQVDFPAWGANVYFTRQVTKNGKIVINEKFVSNYKSWQAVYLRGTKE